MDFTILKRVGVFSDRIDQDSVEETSDGKLTVYRIALSPRPAMECPSCGKPGAVHGRYEKTVRITTSRAYGEVVVAIIPRFVCKNAGCERFGKTFSPRFSGLGRKAEIPAAVKAAAAMEMMSEPSSAKSIAKAYGISEGTLAASFDAMARSVSRGRLGKVLCIDEFRFARSGESRFPSIIVDGATGELLDVVKSRSKDVLLAYFSAIPAAERDGVEFFASDMYDAYRTVKKAFFPGAVHVIDRFHVVKLLTAAMAAERAREFRKPTESSDESYMEEYRFQKSHWRLFSRRAWLPYGTGPSRKWREHMSSLRDILAKRPGLLDLYDATQAMFRLVDGKAKRPAAEEIAWIRAKLRSSGLREALKAADSLEKWEAEIVAAYEGPGRAVSNASAEGTNNRIATMVKTGFGLSSFDRMRKRALALYGRKEYKI